MGLKHILTGWNFCAGPNHKYDKDSAWTPAACYSEGLLLSDSLGNQLWLANICFLPPTSIKILCKGHMQAFPFVFRKSARVLLWDTIWAATRNCAPQIVIRVMTSTYELAWGCDSAYNTTLSFIFFFFQVRNRTVRVVMTCPQSQGWFSSGTHQGAKSSAWPLSPTCS